LAIGVSRLNHGEWKMKMLQRHTPAFVPPPCDAIRPHQATRIPVLAMSVIIPALTWLRMPFAVILSGYPRAQDVVASEYEGRAWCDATERELISDITTWPHKR
jgi:hypothetical protein